MSMYEINTVNNVQDIDTGRINSKSPIVEVFSALSAGKNPNVSDKVKDTAVKTLGEMASKAVDGDVSAISEINSIIRFTVEPKLLESIKIFDFMGSYRQIGYHEHPMVKTWNYELPGARFQASSGDVPFSTVGWSEYPIATQTISSGFAIDYREIQSGNFDGNVAEGMRQVQIDMQNKAVYYAIAKRYQSLKDAKEAGRITHFAETDGITQASVDDMLRVMRGYGKVNICGDYSVVSQFNNFLGYKTFGDNVIPFGADAVAEEVRKTGLLSFYNGSNIVELPNAINWTKLNKEANGYDMYMPQGLLFLIPKGNVMPFQIFLRGGMTSMTGSDIVTRQQLTRFDMEIGADLAKGNEHMIGVISDTNYEVPSL